MLRNRGVVGIGLGSLLSDTGHGMATAALPGILRSLSAPAATLITAFDPDGDSVEIAQGRRGQGGAIWNKEK